MAMSTRPGIHQQAFFSEGKLKMAKHLHEEFAELRRKSFQIYERIFYRMAKACKHYDKSNTYECVFRVANGRRPCTYELCPLLIVEEPEPKKGANWDDIMW